METMQPAAGRFSMRFYFTSLAKVLGTPGSFFRELPEETGWNQSLGFLTVSAAFSTMACLLTQPLESPLLVGAIYFVNAMGMTFIAAGLGYMLMTMFAGRKILFRQFFSVYAFASGVTLLASWIPLFIWLTEPWKWILVGMGLTKTCGLRWSAAVLVIVSSIGVIILFFWSLVPVILKTF